MTSRKRPMPAGAEVIKLEEVARRGREQQLVRRAAARRPAERARERGLGPREAAHRR